MRLALELVGLLVAVAHDLLGLVHLLFDILVLLLGLPHLRLELFDHSVRREFGRLSLEIFEFTINW